MATNQWERPSGSAPMTMCLPDEAAKIARGDEQLAANITWAVGRWYSEVSQRPIVNVHRRTLDDTWRQVIRYFGGDEAIALIGPSHDTLLARRSEGLSDDHNVTRACEEEIAARRVAAGVAEGLKR